MSKVICYTRGDGGVSVVVPSATRLAELMASGMTEDQAVESIRQKDVPPTATNVCITDRAAVPADRRFRNTWRQTGAAAPAVDMPLARAQRMNEVRAERVPKLESVDWRIARAVDKGDLLAEASLRAYRQKLRDVPQTEQPNVDACTTPEALIAWQPTWPTDPAV